MKRDSLKTIRLSDQSKSDIEFIMRDPELLPLFILDNKHIARRVEITDEGDIIFHRYRQGWLSWFFKEIKTYSFVDISMRLIDIFSHEINTEASDKEYTMRSVEMLNDWYKSAISEKNFDKATWLLVLFYILGYRGRNELAKFIKDTYKRPQMIPQLTDNPHTNHINTRYEDIELKGNGKSTITINGVLVEDGQGRAVLIAPDGNMYGIENKRNY
jgi:hypothetical protein